MTAKPWRSIRVPTPPPMRPQPQVEIWYEVELDDYSPARERSTWDARAALAFEMSNLHEAFSKLEVDDIIREAELRGIAFTKRRTFVVVFDGQNFTLARNTTATRLFFKLDSFLRRFQGQS